MTKKNALNSYKELFYNFTEALREDRIAISEGWSNYTDALREDGLISESQYSNWSNPF